jgi:hypothetical protein
MLDVGPAGFAGYRWSSPFEGNMPKFIIERTVPGASRLTDAEVREASFKSLAALRQLGPEIQWIHSFITDDKIYCIYFSPDETLIVEHGRMVGLPVDRIEAVSRLVDPANFREEASPGLPS